MTTKLNQVIAIEKGVKSRAYAVISELVKTIQKAELFNGVARTYQPKTEDGETLPPERKHVQFNVKDILGSLRLSQSDLYDTTAQKDIANTAARANVLVDGDEVLPELPVTTLLFLEKQLTDLRTFVDALPVLDSSEAWEYDPNSGLQKAVPVQTARTKKEQRALVLYPATDKHPAQTQMVTEDVPAGIWTTVRQSGAMPKPQKEIIANRVEKLLIAVKEARERANDIDASAKPQIGARVFNYLFSV